MSTEPTAICSAPCEHGGECGLATGHDGPHEAHGFRGKVLCTWEAS